jgi:hypothetical protein
MKRLFAIILVGILVSGSGSLAVFASDDETPGIMLPSLERPWHWQHRQIRLI